MVRRGSGAEQVVRRLGAHRRCQEHRVGADPNFCKLYHADDPAFWERVYYWNTPVSDCAVVDRRRIDQAGSGDDCKDYNEWLQAWTEIKG